MSFFYYYYYSFKYLSPCLSQAPLSHKKYRPRLAHVVTQTRGPGCLSFLMTTRGGHLCHGNQGVCAQGTNHLCPLPGAAVSWASESQPAPLPPPLLGFLHPMMGAASGAPLWVCIQLPPTPPQLLGHPSPSQGLVSLPTSCGWSADVWDATPRGLG